MRDREYDEAILVLTAYIEEHPENFDPAQRRLQRIMEIRQEYHDVAAELLNTLTGDPGNSEKILRLSRRLEELESSHNSSARQFLNQTRELALFSVNRARLDAVLQEGRERLDRGDYTGAFAAYAGGLDIYQAEFFTGGYGEEAEGQVRKGLAALAGAQGLFPSFLEPLQSGRGALEQLNRRERASLGRYQELYQRLEPALEGLVELRNTLAEVAAVYELQLLVLKDLYPALGDQSFLAFAARLLTGPPGEGEGMIGAVEGLWNGLLPALEQAAAEPALRFYAAALASFREGDYGGSGEALVRAAEYLQVPQELCGRWSLFYENAPVEFLEVLGRSLPAGKGGDFLGYEALARLTGTLGEAALIGAEYRELPGREPALDAWREGRLSAALAEEREGELRQSLELFYARIDALAGRLAGEAARFGGEAARLEGIPGEAAAAEVPASFEEALVLAGELRAEIGGERRAAAIRAYTIANEVWAGRVRDREAELDRGNARLTGADSGGPGGGGAGRPVPWGGAGRP
jgi:hypothetical protein